LQKTPTLTEMASNTSLRILVDILVKQNILLKRQLEQVEAKKTCLQLEMKRRDQEQLESLVGVMTKDSYKELVRLLNTCDCCERHQLRKIKPEDFDKEEVVSFPLTQRTREEWAAEIEHCGCTCRQKTRRLYHEYQTCRVCDD